MTKKPVSLFSPRALTSWCMAGFILFIGTLISWQAGQLEGKEKRLELQGQAVYELASLRARLEGVVLNLFSATSGIAGVIAHRGYISPDLFAALGQQAIDTHPYIRNIGLSPNDVIAQLYPLEGNQPAIGLRYADNGVQYPDVRRARLIGKPIFSGPHQVV